MKYLCLAIFLCGCSTDVATSRDITIEAHEYLYIPSTINAIAGETLGVVLINKGQEKHGITFGLFNSNYTLNPIDPGKTERMVLPVPTQVGTYYFDGLGWDAAAGMNGTMYVHPVVDSQVLQPDSRADQYNPGTQLTIPQPGNPGPSIPGPATPR